MPLNIRVKLVGFPDIRKRLDSDEIQVDLAGSTFGELLRWLQRTHADPARTSLIDGTGRLSSEVMVLRNGREPIPRDRIDFELSDGDQVTFTVIVAGG